MAEPGRPANPQPQETKIGGRGVATVDPRASVLNRSYPWQTDARGWLNFDNLGCTQGWVSNEEKLEMLTDPHIAGLLHLRRTMVMQDGVQIRPTEGVPQMQQAKIVNRQYERAVEVSELCRWMLCNTADSFHRLCMQLQEVDWWRNLAADLMWRDQEWGDYKGKLMLDRMPVYGPGEYVIWRKEGRVIGLQSAQDMTLESGKPKVYPIEKFALMLFRPNHKFRHGIDFATTTQIAHWFKREIQPEWMANITQVGRPYAYAKGPKGVTQDVPLLDQYGEPMKDADGAVIYVAPHRAMAQGLKEGIRAGGFGVFPAESEIGQLEAQAAASGGQFFPNQFDEIHWEFATAILGVGTATQEQRYGSNATAQTGKEIVKTPIYSDKTDTAELIKKSLCTPATHYNFRDPYWDVVPTVTCGDPQQNAWVDLLKSIINSPVSQVQLYDFAGELAERVGLPADDFRRYHEMAIAGEPLPGTVPASMPQGGGAE